MKIIKNTVSLILTAVMILSAMIISVVPASATSERVEYTISATTCGGNCISVDLMEIKICGEELSTDWHTISAFGVIPGTAERSFKDIDVGKIKSISVRNIGSDGWYPNKFTINSPSDNVTIYGGKWIEDECTFTRTDDTVYFALCTSGDFLSGTDATVYMSFIDTSNRETQKYNLTAMHYQINAFEANDVLKRYIALPSENFDKIAKVKFTIEQDAVTFHPPWKVQYINIDVKSGKYEGEHFFKNVNKWCTLDEPLVVDLR